MIGRTVFHYRITDRIGAGGMGVVYKAQDTVLGRTVAVKVLAGELIDDEARQRFAREAQAASQLDHPNICTIYEFGEADDGQLFLAMACYDGESLATKIERGPFALDEAIQITEQIARGLAKAHAAGIVHRDIKPANVLMTRDGIAKIVDFGLAKLASSAKLTRSHTTLGTVSYMAPEQIRGDDVGPQTDIWALGVVLFEMLTGRLPFRGDSLETLLFSTVFEDPASIPEQPEIDRIIKRMLQRDLGLRYQTMDEVLRDLQMLGNMPVDARVDTLPFPRKRLLSAKAGKPRRARRWLAIGAIAVIIIVTGAIALWRMGPLQTRDASSGLITIAVLPFDNLSGGGGRDYLRLALPNEVITILSYNRSLAVRPFALTRRISSGADPQQSGRTLNVTDVLTGHFRESGERIEITLEAVNVEKNNVLWRESVEVAADDLISLRQALSNRIRGGLLPRMGATDSPSGPAQPHNDEAYSLYLRAAAISQDPAPNKDALRFLERSVALDPTYAPAWSALSLRAYSDSMFGRGGEVARDRAEEAVMRALAIDPDLMEASRHVARMRADSGDVIGAYRAAKELVRRRPESGDAHLTLAYALRYGGLLEESARECEVARSLDRTNRLLRACGITYFFMGDIPRAKSFVNLDAGSEWAEAVSSHFLLQTGEAEALFRKGRPVATMYIWWPTFAAYMSKKPEAEVARLAEAAKQQSIAIPDGEASFFFAESIAFCKQDRIALDLLRMSVDRGYCAVPAMDLNPLFADLRDTPEYQEIRKVAVECRQRFIAAREQVK